MARPTSRHPTELELEILKILWRDGRATGRQIQAALRPGRELAYTSVVTILNIMTRKHYLSRKMANGSFLYGPRISELSTTRRMLQDLVQRVFSGSVSAVLLGLIEDHDLDTEELQLIRQLVQDKEHKR